MKKTFTLFALSIFCFTLSAQKLEIIEVNYKLSKEAIKAKKKATLSLAAKDKNSATSSMLIY